MIYSDEKSPLHNKPDYLVCTCMGVMYTEIIQAIELGHTNLELLSENLMIGTGCSSCIDEVLFIVQEYFNSLRDKKTKKLS